MKEGIKVGQTATQSVVVTKDMFAQFEGKVVHPVFSTVSMVYYMEWASRQLILPYLLENEEGMGGRVVVQHLAPSLEGDQLDVVATIKSIKGNQILSTVVIKKGERLVGEGEVIQFVLPKKEIESKLTSIPSR